MIKIDEAKLDKLEDIASRLYLQTPGNPHIGLIWLQALYDHMKYQGLEPGFEVVTKKQVIIESLEE